MKIFIILILFTLISNNVLANEVTVIELHNKSLDQIINESLENNEETQLIISDDNGNNEVVEEENNIEIENSTEENIESTIVLEDNVLINDELEPSDFWEQITKEDLFFLLENLVCNSTPITIANLILESTFMRSAAIVKPLRKPAQVALMSNT